MHTIRNTLFFLGLYLITGCTNQTGLRVMHLKYSTGNDSAVFQYRIVNKDTIKDGPANLYNKRGALVGKLKYLNNFLDGEQKYYYENGQLEKKFFYEDGIATGNGYFFNRDGTRKLNTYYYNGGQIFTESFYPNQKRKLFNILFPTREDSVFYIVLFDSTGKKYYQNGNLLSSSFELFNAKTVYANKQFFFKLFCTQLPGYTTKVFFTTDNDSTERKCTVDSFFAKGSLFFEKKGIQKVTFWSELFDENNKAVMRNFIDFFINVK